MTLQQYISLHVCYGLRRIRQYCLLFKEVVVSKRMLLAGAVIVSGLLWIGSPVLAHHSESAQFDVSKPVKITGVISKVEWMNPHIWFYVDVKDENGKVTTWGFSGGPP